MFWSYFVNVVVWWYVVEVATIELKLAEILMLYTEDLWRKSLNYVNFIYTGKINWNTKQVLNHEMNFSKRWITKSSDEVIKSFQERSTSHLVLPSSETDNGTLDQSLWVDYC